MPDRSLRSGHAVEVCIDEELVVSTIDRVVQDRAVGAELHAGCPAKLLVAGERAPNLGGHGAFRTFVDRTSLDLRAVRVPDQEADSYARASFSQEYALKTSILR